MTTLPGFVAHFLSTHLRGLPEPRARHDGQTVIVTGANVGLGLEAARHFVRLGAAKVVLACRNAAKAEAAKQDIERSTGVQGVAEAWSLDLASFQSVKDFAKRAEEELGRLDVLLANAGVVANHFELWEGFDSTITTNVLSQSLLALLLLPMMKRTAVQHNTRPHLAIVASDAHAFASFKARSWPNMFDYFKTKDTISLRRYNDSKLLNVWTARELAARLDASAAGGQSPVIVNATNPGLCASDIFRHMSFPLHLVLRIGLFVLGRSSEMGSRTLLAAAAGGPDTHGCYMDSCEVRPPSRLVLSAEGAALQKRAFDEMVAILEGVQPGIAQAI